MKKRKLGTTDLYVTPVAFGVLTMGGSQMDLPLQEGAELIRYAIDKGINFFDTALVYNGDVSEQHIERVLKDYAKREELVVATKFTPGSCLLCNNMCRDTENKNFNGLKTNYCLPPFPTSTLEMFKASGIRQHQIAGQLESGCHG